jgi:hypothetical protein
MPNAVVRYFSAKDARSLERILDQFAHDNPAWEIVSASQQLEPGIISVVVVVKHVGNPGNPPANFSGTNE